MFAILQVGKVYLWNSLTISARAHNLSGSASLVNEKPPKGSFGISWWPEAESNQRHKDFQSSVLSTAVARFETSEPAWSIDSYRPKADAKVFFVSCLSSHLISRTSVIRAGVEIAINV